MRLTDYLDACERANVMVVQPSAEGRNAGGRPVRLGVVNDAEATTDITTWVLEGGPGVTDAHAGPTATAHRQRSTPTS